LSRSRSGKRSDPEDDGNGSVQLGKRAFIDVNSVILPNARIGDVSIIDAGSVVTKHTPPYVAAAGNPARIILEALSAVKGVLLSTRNLRSRYADVPRQLSTGCPHLE